MTFKSVKLKSVCSLIKRGISPVYGDNGVPVLNQRCIRNQVIDFTLQRTTDTNVRPIPPEKYLQPFDILVNSTGVGTLGRVAQIIRLSQPTTADSHLTIVRPDPSSIFPNFLGYVLRAKQPTIEQLGRGSTGQTELPRDVLGDLEIPLPPLNEQEAIVEILSSFDEKVDVNHRLNAALESGTQAIFKSWFVDFDPVRAKAEGRQPEGIDTETSVLFPDDFEESELGLIPSGWAVQSLSEHVKAVKGLSYKGSGLTDADGGMPMHNLNSVYEGGGYKYDGIKHYNGEYQERHIARAGDLIVTNTEQGHDLLLIGYPALIPNRYSAGLFSHHIFRVTPLENSYITPRFLYFLMRTDFFHEVIGGYTNGTTVNMLYVDGLQRPLFVVPPPELVACFDRIVMPMLEKMEINHEEAERLAETRDALLPKLISGEVRVGVIDG